MRRTIAAVAVLALAAPILPASARDGTTYGPDRVAVWQLRRAGAAPRALEFTLRLKPQDQRSTLAVVGTERRPGTWKVDLGYYSVWDWSSGLYPIVYGGDTTPTPVTSPACPDPALCTHRDDGEWVSYGPHRFDAKLYGKLDFFVATVNMPVEVDVASTGWTKKLLTPAATGPNLRIYTNRDGDGAGAVAANFAVEHFKYLAAPGGPHGSVAWGRLPCDPVTATAPAPGRQMTGVGAAVLHGGRVAFPSTRYLNCEDYHWAGDDRTHTKTTWTLYGDAVGVSITKKRLAIFDYPPVSG